MTAEKIKEIVLNSGADLCGIAPVERFSEAPEGFHPEDIFHGCKSVIVFAKRVPGSSILAASPVPYTHVNDIITKQVDKLTMDLCLIFEDMDIIAVPIPSDDPYEYWIEERHYGRAILSLRHAAEKAGLGRIGKNTLVVTPEYGNMIQIGAILTDLELEGDPLMEQEICKPGCELCISSCPNWALDGVSVDQEACRKLSNYITPKGYVLKKCNICRTVCPHRFGLKKEKGGE